MGQMSIAGYDKFQCSVHFSDISIHTDHKSMAILPLAVEYQMETLQHICEDQLMERLPCGQSSIPKGIPLLVMLTLAERLQLKELTAQMIEKCAARLTIQEIDRQKELPENNSLPAETYHQLIK